MTFYINLGSILPTIINWHLICKYKISIHGALLRTPINRRNQTAEPSGLAVKGVCLRPHACWYCVFESRQGYGCLSVVSVVFSWVEVSATDLSLVQRSPTKRGVSEYDREASIIRRPWPTRDCYAIEKKRTQRGSSKFHSLRDLTPQHVTLFGINNICAQTFR